MLRHGEFNIPDPKAASCSGTQGVGLFVLTFITVLLSGFLVTNIAEMPCDAAGITMLAPRLALLLTSPWVRLISTSLALHAALSLAMA